MLRGQEDHREGLSRLPRCLLGRYIFLILVQLPPLSILPQSLAVVTVTCSKCFLSWCSASLHPWSLPRPTALVNSSRPVWIVLLLPKLPANQNSSSPCQINLSITRTSQKHPSRRGYYHLPSRWTIVDTALTPLNAPHTLR